MARDERSVGFVTFVRLTVDMTQEEFAEAVGVSRSYLTMVENGKRRINVEILRGMRRRFGISIDAFLDSEEKS